MSYFRIVAQGPSYADPVEKIVTTAVEAEQVMLSMTRLCGRSGSVVLYDRRGGKIGPRKLSSLVREEKGKPGPPGLAC